jgi:hypothetical protein
MPLTAQALNDADRVVSAVQVSETSFAARLAFGVRNKPRSGETTWIILEVANGVAEAAGTRGLPSSEAPEGPLEVALGIAATETVWADAISDPGFLQAIEAKKFFVTGETPFFIRFLEPVLDVWRSLRTL